MKKLLLLFLIGLFSFACSKEKQVEKNLSSKGGRWKVESYYNSYYYSSMPQIQTVTEKNVGEYIFNTDGTGSFRLSIDGDVAVEDFSYFFKNTSIVIIADGYSIEYDMQWKKNNLVMSYHDKNTTPDGVHEFDETIMTLVKN